MDPGHTMCRSVSLHCQQHDGQFQQLSTAASQTVPRRNHLPTRPMMDGCETNDIQDGSLPAFPTAHSRSLRFCGRDQQSIATQPVATCYDAKVR